MARKTTKKVQDATIALALSFLEERAAYAAEVLERPEDVKNYLRLKLAEIEHEEFWCVWLNARNAVISIERMFNGTLTQTSVYPREIVKRALQVNAAAVLFAHNHPSGTTTPSTADELLTCSLKRALDIVDVRVLDHFIVTAHTSPLSFAERGLL